MHRSMSVIILSLLLFGCAVQQTPDNQLNKEGSIMKLTSPAFTESGKIPAKYTCDGNNINPPLIISEVPEGAKSLALIMDDPDAVVPAGKIWDHWVVWNIPHFIREIKEGQEPRGVRGRGTGNNLTYKGPCPPDGVHRYFFKLYALKSGLQLPEGSTKAEVEAAMKGYILAKAELMGRYERSK